MEEYLKILKVEQAGLSRATLEISSEFSSNLPLRTHKSHSARFEVSFTSNLFFYWRLYLFVKYGLFILA